MLPPTAAAQTLDGELEEEGVLNKKLYERHPLIFYEKSPLKIFRINLETPLYNAPASERSLNRHGYHTFRKFFSIQRLITDKLLQIEKKMLLCFFL